MAFLIFFAVHAFSQINTQNQSAGFFKCQYRPKNAPVTQTNTVPQATTSTGPLIQARETELCSFRSISTVKA
jgi:hypothetical protein